MVGPGLARSPSPTPASPYRAHAHAREAGLLEGTPTPTSTMMVMGPVGGGWGLVAGPGPESVGDVRELRSGHGERTASSRSSSCAVATQIVVSAAP